MVFSGIIFNDEFTTPEVMAIILHEIGHNFQAAISRKMEYYVIHSWQYIQ